MASLKELRNRINSVRSTRKITSAMKMVAAAKLRRAQEQAEAARPYAVRMQRMLGELAAGVEGRPGVPALLAGTGQDQTRLIVVCTTDRGLCGGFNTHIVREARRRIDALQKEGKTVKVLCVGRKGRDQLRRGYQSLIVDTLEDIAKPELNYDSARRVADRITEMYGDGEFDVCNLIYARFKSPIRQIVTTMQLVPFSVHEEAAPGESEDAESAAQSEGDAAGAGGSYIFEPAEEQILADLLPRNLAVQVYRALLENNAGEQGARMTAMDGATRNADDMIDKLTMTYNRTRQAVITTELNEIVSAAESMK
ncbi:ATP synthase F1 subcomplex gamma subunit [Limimonas halophila]|uniref:ATP synthase gamma chain n=1 Tax=Limimonas halophila TaxID=1082479 RepID=A0A1G7UG19_9PROT|nr:F0F1 ATP synthase subunit gamma [Limimonas halophila]SDG46512.1 ATP synthase F1 subcomplex gamma subunit [Limimonas halophila]